MAGAFHFPVIFLVYSRQGITRKTVEDSGSDGNVLNLGLDQQITIGGVMRTVVPSKRFWVSLAAFVLAVSVFIPATNTLAQDNNAASSRAQFSPLSPQVQDLIQNVKEIYFPFNIYSRVVNVDTLQNDGSWLSQHTDSPLWVQGYADIRGDIFYNLVLSYRRAQFVKEKLIKSGVSESRIQFATGWGKLYPVCQATDDSCYQKQRRVDIVPPDSM
jgi:outer membrane protein OmpA-like peptidoglycan-associated protein